MSNLVSDADEDIEYCTKHPTREATLHCIRCARPMCTECVVLTPTGYICKECTRRQEDRFFTATNIDYPIVFSICLVGNILACIAGLFVGGWWLGLFIGGAAGSIFGTFARTATGRRVGRYSAHVGVAGAIVGACIAPLVYTVLRFDGAFMDLRLLLQIFGATLAVCTVGFALAVYAIYQRRI